MTRTLIPTVFLLSILLAGVAYGFTLEGRIIDVGDGRGVPGLTVRLTPPTPSASPRKATLSDKYGRFRFSDVARGAYWLEAYQGTRVLYREKAQIDRNLTKEIRLRRR
jgi:hypothetical protein